MRRITDEREPLAARPIRMVYTGKFAPLWNTLEMTQLPARLGALGVAAELHMVGDKVHEVAGPNIAGGFRMIATFDAIATGTDIQRRIGVKTSRDEPLARFTTMRVGGPADLFASVHNAFELKAIVRFARSQRVIDAVDLVESWPEAF